MEDVVAIIDRIIEEHKVILSRTRSLEKVANDAGALQAIDQSKDTFMPGRHDNIQALKELEELRAKTEEGLIAHFDFEETKLLQAFQKYGDEKLLEALKTLLVEHKEVRQYLKDLKAEVESLTTGQLSSHLWGAKAYDMRAHITRIHKVIETHARNEQVLFQKLRGELAEQK